MSTLTIQIPDVDMVNFSDPIEVESYVGLMIQAGNEMGAFITGFRPAAEWKRVRKAAGEVTRRLEALFPLMSPAQKMMSETAYDLAHRITYGKAADQSILDRNLLEAFDAKIHGDKAIDEYVLYRMIDLRILQRDTAFFDKPLTWTSLCLHDWLESQDTRKPDYDQICRTTILLRAQLGVYVSGSPERYKKSLFNRNRHYLDRTYNQVRDLMVLNHFFLASLRYLSNEESDRYRSSINNALIAHPDTNRFHRELLKSREANSLHLSAQSRA